MDCSPPGSSVYGILQPRILDWAAIPFSRGISRFRGWTQVFCIADRFFTIWATHLLPWSKGISLSISSQVMRSPQKLFIDPEDARKIAGVLFRPTGLLWCFHGSSVWEEIYGKNLTYIPGRLGNTEGGEGVQRWSHYSSVWKGKWVWPYHGLCGCYRKDLSLSFQKAGH